jgi:hypothetical protein
MRRHRRERVSGLGTSVRSDRPPSRLDHQHVRRRSDGHEPATQDRLFPDESNDRLLANLKAGTPSLCAYVFSHPNLWERLTREIKAWPTDMHYSLEAFREVLPAYKAAGAIQGTVKVEQVVETRYVTQALKELGA